MSKIIIFGDSIVWGAYDEEGGWTSRLRKNSDRKILHGSAPSFEIYSLGIAGDTSQDVRIRFDNEMKARSGGDDIKLIIFSVGVNDSLLEVANQTNRIPIKNYQANLEFFIKQSKNYSKNVLCLGLTPVDEDKLKSMPWPKTHVFLNREIKKYDEVIRAMTIQYNLDFIDIYKEFNDTILERLMFDGLHPNSRGHELIYNVVMDFLKKEQYI